MSSAYVVQHYPPLPFLSGPVRTSAPCNGQATVNKLQQQPCPLDIKFIIITIVCIGALLCKLLRVSTKTRNSVVCDNFSIATGHVFLIMGTNVVNSCKRPNPLMTWRHNAHKRRPSYRGQQHKGPSCALLSQMMRIWSGISCPPY